MTKEIKTTTNFWGEEVEEIYEDGEKVGETKTEKDFWGDDIKVTRDNDNMEVAETKTEKDFWGDEKEVTYDPNGNKIAETIKVEGLFEDRKDIYKPRKWYEEGKKIGELRRKGLIDKREVLEEKAGCNIDLTTKKNRDSIGEEKGNLESKVNEGRYFTNHESYMSGYSKLEKIGWVILAIPLVAYYSAVAIAYAIGITAVLCTAYLVFSVGCN